ncbi:hypothetical protein WG66_009730, partial [Moniliophthora roreri]
MEFVSALCGLPYMLVAPIMYSPPGLRSFGRTTRHHDDQDPDLLQLAVAALLKCSE